LILFTKFPEKFLNLRRIQRDAMMNFHRLWRAGVIHRRILLARTASQYNELFIAVNNSFYSRHISVAKRGKKQTSDHFKVCERVRKCTTNTTHLVYFEAQEHD